MSNTQKEKTVTYYLKRIFNSLPERRKKQFFILLSGMVLVAVFETLVLGIISLFATSLASPDNLIASTKFKYVIKLLHITKPITGESLIIFLSIAVVIFILLKNSILGFMRYWLARYAAVIQGHIGHIILDKYLYTDFEWYLTKNPHDMFITIGWRSRVGNFINGILFVISNTIMVIIMLSGIIYFQPIMMLILISILGIVSFIIFKIIKKEIDINSKKIYKFSTESNLDASMVIHGMKDVRILGLEKKFLNDFSGKLFKLASFQGLQSILRSMPTWLMEVIGFSLLSASLIIMLIVMKLNRLEIFGTISLLAVTVWRVLPAINKILGGITSLRSNFPFIINIYDQFDEIDYYQNGVQNYRSVLSKSKTSKKMVFKDSIEFRDLLFRYNVNKRDILVNINCKIKKGTSIGIIGHSGAGKSTFVDLFIGLLRPSGGGVFVDGYELNETNSGEFRRNIGYVSQFPYIYDCSLAENIAFGKPKEDVNDDRILEICNQASIDFLDELEDGIHTRIGDRGAMISGGQKQRVAIARALYNNPEILIFDEATSSLDTKSELEIQKTIDSFKGQQTLLVIAHRLTTVENCDYLIWLEKGHIVKMDIPEKIIKEYSEYKENSSV